MKKAPKPDVETLRTDPAYQLIAELGFHEMLPFVMKQIKRRGVFPAIYFAVNLGMLIFIILLIVKGLSGQYLSWKQIMLQGVSGILAGSILVIPIHELLHGLAYRLLGAKKIIFGADPAQMIFYVTAHKYPVSGREVHLLSMTPFVLINLLTLTATALFFKDKLLFSAFFLLFHNMMCIGDFAISGYLCGAKGKVYTFDEPERKMSYFYQEK